MKNKMFTLSNMDNGTTLIPGPVRHTLPSRLLGCLTFFLTIHLLPPAGMMALAADAITPATGDSWTSPATGMTFVWIAELDLWVGKYEVTNGEFRRFRPDHDSGSFQNHSLNGERQPVVEVGFDDALAFVHWLNQREARHLGNLRYRLPSEGEWLAYARCGDERAYPWGDEMPPAYGNYHGEEGADTWEKIADYNDDHPVTSPVEDSGENDWGLFGVGGNVWELTAQVSAPRQFSAWRGASWADGVAYTLRCDSRDDGSGDPSHIGGFRLVLAPRGRPATAEPAPPPRQTNVHYEDRLPVSDENMLIYVIQDDDTWEGIARLFVVRLENLLRANQDDGRGEPAPGRRIRIPPSGL